MAVHFISHTASLVVSHHISFTFDCSIFLLLQFSWLKYSRHDIFMASLLQMENSLLWAAFETEYFPWCIWYVLKYCFLLRVKCTEAQFAFNRLKFQCGTCTFNVVFPPGDTLLFFYKDAFPGEKKLELHLCLLHIFWYDKISYKMVQISIMWNNKWTNITSSWWGRVYNPATKSPAWAGDRGWVFLLCITPKTQAGRLTLHVLTSPWSHFDAPVGCLSCFLHCLESH